MQQPTARRRAASWIRGAPAPPAPRHPATELTGSLDPGTFLRRPEATLLIAHDDGELAGWADGHELIHPDGERTMLLYALDVATTHQRRGHGKALVSAFVEDARARGCTEVWVLTDHDNDVALATYTSAGGVAEGSGTVMFTWRLAPGNHSSPPAGPVNGPASRGSAGSG